MWARLQGGHSAAHLDRQHGCAGEGHRRHRVPAFGACECAAAAAICCGAETAGIRLFPRSLARESTYALRACRELAVWTLVDAHACTSQSAPGAGGASSAAIKMSAVAQWYIVCCQRQSPGDDISGRAQRSQRSTPDAALAYVDRLRMRTPCLPPALHPALELPVSTSPAAERCALSACCRNQNLHNALTIVSPWCTGLDPAGFSGLLTTGDL